MRVFIWSRVEKVSDNYHEGGGLVVFAETEERARALATEDGCVIAADDSSPDVREVVGGEERVYKFQDAGCCG